MRKVYILILSVAVIILAACTTNVKGDSRVGKNLNISYDGRAILINGSRTLFIAGAIHYPRSSAGMWDSLFKKAVAGGVNLIQTYVFWNLHEPVRRQYNFAGNADLVTFLQTAKNNGLFVNLRIGPYVCAEWNYGGFPGWLKNISGIQFRTYNQPFMDEMQTFVTYITNLLWQNKMFGPQGGPVIMAQIENEYGWVETAYGTAGRQYALWAATFANGLNLGIPWLMCAQGDISTVINTANGFYGDNFIYGLSQSFPNQPAMWTENWAGWFQNYGEAKPTRPTEDLAFSVARWYGKGGTYMAYYMYYGGTNFGRGAGGPNVVNSYAYDAPLNEFGFPNEPKYSHTTKLHSIIMAYSNSILTGPYVWSSLGSANQEADTWGTGTNQITFMSNMDPVKDATVTFQGTTYHLPRWSSTIIGGGKLLFNSAQIDSSIIIPPRTMYTLQALTPTGYWLDTPGVWGHGVVTQGIPEQLSITNDTTDYLWYTTNVSLGKWDSRYISLSYVQSSVTIFAGGIPANNTVQSGFLSSNFMQGPVQLLTSYFGLNDYSLYLETYQTGILGTVYIGPTSLNNQQWVMQAGLQGEYLKVFTPAGYASVTWNANWQYTIKRPVIWYAFHFDLTTTSTTGYALDLIGLNKGVLYVNGYMIGRYYLVIGNGNCTYCNYAAYTSDTCRLDCGLPSQRYFHIPADWLLPSGNLVTIFEEFGGNPSSVQLVAPSPAPNSGTTAPTASPTTSPTTPPTAAPTKTPTTPPTTSPTTPPTVAPTKIPTTPPASPTSTPTSPPTTTPTKTPTTPPASPTGTPTSLPSVPPTARPPTAAPAPPTSTSSIQLQLNSGSSYYWMAISISGDNGATAKIELKDGGIYSSTWGLLQSTSWGPWLFAPSGALTLPLTLRLTSSSGVQVVATNIITSITQTSLIDTKLQYGGGSSAEINEEPYVPATSAPSTNAPSTNAPATATPATLAPATSAPSTSSPTSTSGSGVQLTILSGSNAWWLAVSISGNKDTASVTIKDAGAVSTAAPMTSSGWGSYVYTPVGSALAPPLTITSTSVSGSSVTFTVPSLTVGAVVSSGNNY